MRDTTPTAERVHLAAIRAVTPAQRLRQALDLSEAARALALAGLRLRFPDHSVQELIDIWRAPVSAPLNRRAL